MLRFGILFLLMAPVFAQWAPFEMIWNVDGRTDADVSFLLDAPAGKSGFVQANNGHLYTTDGKRLRLWGVNFSFTASFPPKELAPKVAAHLARFGVNCVRIHHHDWRSPRGLIDAAYPDSRHLNADNLDRLDFLIAEFKKRGIYTDINLNVAREFREADGVKDSAQLGYGKALTYFDPKLIELQMEFARAYLTHRNPYTGNEYRNEPAIALVEIVNENSLIESWVRGRLRGLGFPPDLRDKTWVDIPASYARDLTRMFGGPRLEPKDFGAASPEQFRKEAEFYMGLESAFFRKFGAFLKDDLKVRQPVVGTSAHAGSLSPYPLLKSASQLDVVDGHTYWQHPRYIDDPATKQRSFEITNTPQVDVPAKSSVGVLARVAVDGKPFIVSEVNEPYPNEYGAELVPILAAYGALQDWDGLFWYSFAHDSADTWKPHPPGHFDIRQDPVKMSQLATGALIFHRSDFAAAEKTLLRDYTREQVADSLRMKSDEQPWFTPGMDSALALMHGMRVRSFDAKAPFQPALSAPKVIKSDTNELIWREGLITGASKRAAMIVGRLDQGKLTAGNMDVESETRFGAVMLVALDENSSLLTAGARTSNEGMQWNAQRTSTPAVGTAPIMIEPLKAIVTLRGHRPDAVVTITALDGAGKAMGAPKRAKKSGASWRVTLDQPTPWYRVTVR